MKILLFAFVITLLSSCGGCKIRYAAYIPSQNRFVEYRNRENPYGDYEYRTGDTVLINGEKAVIVCR